MEIKIVSVCYNAFMSTFVPGKIIKEFTTKSGKHAVIRYPQIEDAQALLDFINEVSLENTFIRFAGEQQTIEEETAYLTSELEKLETGDAVKLFCFVEGEFAGVCDIHRDTGLLTRRQHVGIFGLVIRKAFRGEGIGKVLAQAVIDEAKSSIDNLQLIALDCFANNEPALNLYVKLGFKEWGRFPQALMHKGEYVDEVHMSLQL
jgi:RimJ/RimL family protein N-acetyltransferase